jgi:hypothetical protein
MAEFFGLPELKSFVFAPLKAQLAPKTNRMTDASNSNDAKSQTSKSQTDGDETQTHGSPALLATSLATRHDHHNIEIKTVSELGERPSLVSTDIFIFFPRTFELSNIGKAELAKDFRSRMRLALPSNTELGSAAFESALMTMRLSLNKVGAAENSGVPTVDLSHPLSEELTEAAKDLCAIIAETLKRSAVDHARQLLMSQKVGVSEDICVAGLNLFTQQIRNVSEMIIRVRAEIERPTASAVAVLMLFDEYLSQLYVHFLGTVRNELTKIGTPAAGQDSLPYRQTRQTLETLLDELQEKEARHRNRFYDLRPEQESDLDRERRLVRLSHLKKFFQSRTFVDVSRQQAAKKFSESTATIGTALAGIIAALLERFSRPEITNVAFGGLFVLSFGVIMYVLRDRLKDKAKIIFQEKASKLLPDFEQQLMAKDKRIGVAKEWFRILDSSKLPDEVRAIRNRASSSEMELRLPEDVLHCRKVQEVQGTRLTSLDSPTLNRALHENTRINFERHLKHMDDPFKDFTDLDVTGRFTQSRSHRVYHFYLCVRTVSQALEPNRSTGPVASSSLPKRLWPKRHIEHGHSEQNQVYRIVLDKNGVVRLEDLTTD